MIGESEEARRRILAMNVGIRACRRCHAAGHLDEAVSLPTAHDPDSEAPLPRILLIGQAPSRRAMLTGRAFVGAGGDRLREWLEAGGVPRADFWRRIHFAAITQCYPGRLPGAKGDRVPSPAEQALCRPWVDQMSELVRPRVVILVGLLAAKTFLGPIKSLSAVVGQTVERDGVLFIPLPHPSGVSRWHNDPANVEAVARAMRTLRATIDAERL